MTSKERYVQEHDDWIREAKASTLFRERTRYGGTFWSKFRDYCKNFLSIVGLLLLAILGEFLMFYGIFSMLRALIDY